jgi:hypothetical protein
VGVCTPRHTTSELRVFNSLGLFSLKQFMHTHVSESDRGLLELQRGHGLSGLQQSLSCPCSISPKEEVPPGE